MIEILESTPLANSLRTTIEFIFLNLYYLKNYFIALSLIHIDLFGPIDLPSISKKMYTLVVVDEYTMYTWVIFMNKKSETLKKLPNLMKLIQNEKTLTLVKIRSNGGSEFLNKAIRKYCEVHGILHQLSIT